MFETKEMNYSQYALTYQLSTEKNSLKSWTAKDNNVYIFLKIYTDQQFRKKLNFISIFFFK